MISTHPRSARIEALFLKTNHAWPMLRSSFLDLDPDQGILGDVNPKGESPRQLCIATSKGLTGNHVKQSGSRANIVLDSSVGSVSSGCLLSIGESLIRMTFACEPCAHGAQMAEAPMRLFRTIDRHLGFVIRAGRITEGALVLTYPDRFPMAPDSFRDRCAWALAFLPAGKVVTSYELIRAIGASRAYLRVLPRWMSAAGVLGMPIHRVLSAHLEAPSWAPDARMKLAQEGLQAHDYPAALYDLTHSIWFSQASTIATRGA